MPRDKNVTHAKTRCFCLPCCARVLRDGRRVGRRLRGALSECVYVHSGSMVHVGTVPSSSVQPQMCG